MVAERPRRHRNNRNTATKWRKNTSTNQQQQKQSFQVDSGDYSDLEIITAEFAPFHRLWECAIEFKTSSEARMTGPMELNN